MVRRSRASCPGSGCRVSDRGRIGRSGAVRGNERISARVLQVYQSIIATPWRAASAALLSPPALPVSDRGPNGQFPGHSDHQQGAIPRHAPLTSPNALPSPGAAVHLPEPPCVPFWWLWRAGSAPFCQGTPHLIADSFRRRLTWARIPPLASSMGCLRCRAGVRRWKMITCTC